MREFYTTCLIFLGIWQEKKQYRTIWNRQMLFTFFHYYTNSQDFGGWDIQLFACSVYSMNFENSSIHRWFKSKTITFHFYKLNGLFVFIEPHIMYNKNKYYTYFIQIAIESLQNKWTLVASCALRSIDFKNLYS